MAVALGIESKYVTFVKGILSELGKWNISAIFHGLVLTHHTQPMLRHS